MANVTLNPFQQLSQVAFGKQAAIQAPIAQRTAESENPFAGVSIPSAITPTLFTDLPNSAQTFKGPSQVGSCCNLMA